MPELVGQPIDRVDGRLKVTGGARYAADAPVKNPLYAALVQATIAKGEVEIDPAAAEAAPGVVAVLTHANAPKIKGGGGIGESRPPLADANVHYAGQVIAVVVANSLEQARSAARKVKATYKPGEAKLPASLKIDLDALDAEDTAGDVDAAFAAGGKSGAVVGHEYTTPIETHNPMEPSATVATWEGDKLTLFDATQWIGGVQGVMASAFGIDKSNVRVICPFLGGAFGCKALIWPHQLIAAMAAKAVQRPVKVVLTRSQMFTSCGHRPASRQSVTIAADAEGKVLGIRHVSAGVTSQLNGFAEPAGASAQGPYAFENGATAHKLSKCHTASPTFMRAPGETPGMYALESAMDELAHALKLDPVEFRLRNVADVEPRSKRPWSSHHLRDCYRIGAEKFGWSKRSAEPRSMHDGELLVGWGVGTASFPGNRSGASARITLQPDGRILVQCGTHDMGTGSYTVFSQVAADAVGVPIDRIDFELGDSKLPAAPMSAGSNTAATVSQAVIDAARALRKQLAETAIALAKSPFSGANADALKIVDGHVIGEGGAKMPLAELASAAGKPISADATARPSRENFGKYAFNSFGAHFCEVKVDEWLGRVRVTRFLSVIDIGRVLNRKTAHSQIVGGVVMGIGMALTEATVLDPRNGYPVNDSFADYAIPVHADIRDLDCIFIDKPDPHINELGCRGVGEIGITGVAAAVANAVFHATGKRVRDLPITPEKLL